MAGKIVIVKGSPRKNGNSATLAGRVAAGAEATGAKVESFYQVFQILFPANRYLPRRLVLSHCLSYTSDILVVFFLFSRADPKGEAMFRSDSPEQ